MVVVCEVCGYNIGRGLRENKIIKQLKANYRALEKVICVEKGN